MLCVSVVGIVLARMANVVVVNDHSVRHVTGMARLCVVRGRRTNISPIRRYFNMG